MKTVRHIAHAVGSTRSDALPVRIDLRTGSHTLVADEPAAAGGNDAGPSPFGLLLSALAACTAMTLRMYATRKGWEVSAIQVDVRYDVDGDGNGIIDRTITVPGNLDAEHRDHLADIAERTPVTLAIRTGTPITTRFELHGVVPDIPNSG